MDLSALIKRKDYILFVVLFFIVFCISFIDRMHYWGFTQLELVLLTACVFLNKLIEKNLPWSYDMVLKTLLLIALDFYFQESFFAKLYLLTVFVVAFLYVVHQEDWGYHINFHFILTASLLMWFIKLPLIFSALAYISVVLGCKKKRYFYAEDYYQKVHTNQIIVTGLILQIVLVLLLKKSPNILGINEPKKISYIIIINLIICLITYPWRNKIKSELSTYKTGWVLFFLAWFSIHFFYYYGNKSNSEYEYFIQLMTDFILSIMIWLYYFSSTSFTSVKLSHHFLRTLIVLLLLASYFIPFYYLSFALFIFNLGLFSFYSKRKSTPDIVNTDIQSNLTSTIFQLNILRELKVNNYFLWIKNKKLLLKEQTHFFVFKEIAHNWEFQFYNQLKVISEEVEKYEFIDRDETDLLKKKFELIQRLETQEHFQKRIHFVQTKEEKALKKRIDLKESKEDENNVFNPKMGFNTLFRLFTSFKENQELEEETDLLDYYIKRTIHLFHISIESNSAFIEEEIKTHYYIIIMMLKNRKSRNDYTDIIELHPDHLLSAGRETLIGYKGPYLEDLTCIFSELSLVQKADKLKGNHPKIKSFSNEDVFIREYDFFHQPKDYLKLRSYAGFLNCHAFFGPVFLKNECKRIQLAPSTWEQVASQMDVYILLKGTLFLALENIKKVDQNEVINPFSMLPNQKVTFLISSPIQLVRIDRKEFLKLMALGLIKV